MQNIFEKKKNAKSITSVLALGKYRKEMNLNLKQIEEKGEYKLEERSIN